MCVNALHPSIQLMSYFNQCLIGRNQDYMASNLNFAVNVIKSATIISMFSKPLKPYVVMSFIESVLLNWSQDRCTCAIKPSVANSTPNGINQTHG